MTTLPLRTAAGAALLAGIAAGQSASYGYFGAPGTVGCGPFGSQVTHFATSLPQLGTTFTVAVPTSNGACSYLCNLRLFATGFSNTSFHGAALPYSLPGSCGQLRVSLESVTLLPLGGGSGATVQLSLPVPNVPSLAGAEFFQQSISLTYILGGLNAVAWGRAGHGTIGT